MTTTRRKAWNDFRKFYLSAIDDDPSLSAAEKDEKRSEANILEAFDKKMQIGELYSPTDANHTNIIRKYIWNEGLRSLSEKKNPEKYAAFWEELGVDKSEVGIRKKISVSLFFSVQFFKAHTIF